MKTFFWKDKTGRGATGHPTFSSLLDADDEDYNGIKLSDWAAGCDEGGSFENATDHYTCISDVDDEDNSPAFYITDIPDEWDACEVHPVVEIGPGVYDVCEDDDATMWCVYLHTPKGINGIECVADLPTKELAHSLADLIEKAAKNYKP